MIMTISVILANLNPAEYKRVLRAKIPYSGATGADANPGMYGGVAPYIATFDSEFSKAIQALHWHNFVVESSGVQWIVRKRKVPRKHVKHATTRVS